MSAAINYRYLGGKDAKGKDLQPAQGDVDPLGRSYDPYLPDDDLIEAVNLAIDLGLPLLLEGEPGCGKTRLAGAIAYEFTHKYLKPKPNRAKQNIPGQNTSTQNASTQNTSKQNTPEWWPYYIWNVKSIGRAKDGLYQFDAVLRLRDAQIFGTDPEKMKAYLGEKESDAIRERLLDKTKYVSYGPLGKAFLEPQYRPIVLIDEIDKADSDFPNDLLFELDRMGFEVPEAEIPFRAAPHKPIIVITSNRERPLPEAFLRRCLYFCLDFPKQQQLELIVRRRFGQQLTGKAELIEQAIAKVMKMRSELQKQPGSKPPGTSEILQFMEVLLKQTEPRQQEVLETLATQSPFLGILLKTQPDQEQYRKTIGAAEHG